MDVKATLHMIRNNMPELKDEKALNLAPGAKGEAKMAVAEKRPDDPVRPGRTGHQRRRQDRLL